MKVEFSIAFVLTLAFASCGPVARGQMIGSDFLTGNIFDIDPTTGATSNVKATGLPFLIDIACSPTGTVYGVVAGGASATILYTIDPATGKTSPVGPTGLPVLVEGDLAFSPAGVLYAFDASRDRLITINTATGAATYVSTAAVASDDISSLFFVGSALYAVDNRSNAGGNARLIRLNPVTGALISDVGLNVDFNGGTASAGTAGAEANPSTGIVYLATGGPFIGPGALYMLDVATPSLTLVGSSAGLANVGGLTFVVPEPTSLTALTLLAVAGIRRPRRCLG